MIEGEDNLSFYMFNKRWFAKGFCKTCGTATHNAAQPIPQGELDQMSEKIRGFFDPVSKVAPINLRIFNDLNVNDLNIKHIDGYNEHEPRYVEP